MPFPGCGDRVANLNVLRCPAEYLLSLSSIGDQFCRISTASRSPFDGNGMPRHRATRFDNLQDAIALTVPRLSWMELLGWSFSSAAKCAVARSSTWT